MWLILQHAFDQLADVMPNGVPGTRKNSKYFVA